MAVADRFPDATVIGSDQMAVIDGQILGKPGGVSAACSQLALLSGRTHELITALCVIQNGRVIPHTDITRLTMRRLAAQGQQVLVVTHSPQVAARADQHWQVSKSADATRIATTVTPLAPAEREEEIARMLSGAEITAEARAAARTLIAG